MQISINIKVNVYSLNSRKLWLSCPAATYWRVVNELWRTGAAGETRYFGSHVTHEVTMNYAMRSVATARYKLIHNLNYGGPFPIDQDFYLSPTFTVTRWRHLERWCRHHKRNTRCLFTWFAGYAEPNGYRATTQLVQLSAYYYRDEWELFDLNDDPHELYNVAHKKTHKVTPFLFHNQAYSETFT